MNNITSQNLTELMFNHTPKYAGEINATLVECGTQCQYWYFSLVVVAGFLFLFWLLYPFIVGKGD